MEIDCHRDDNAFSSRREKFVRGALGGQGNSWRKMGFRPYLVFGVENVNLSLTIVRLNLAVLSIFTTFAQNFIKSYD